MCATWSQKGTFLSTTFFRKCDSVKSMTYKILQGDQKKVPFCYHINIPNKHNKGRDPGLHRDDDKEKGRNIMRQALFIGAIASVLALNAFATSSTVTSKDYVDAQDALKQNKIPATGTNASTPGDTVVTYTSTAGTIGERGIYDDWNVSIENSLQDNLVTAGVLLDATDEIYDYVDDEISNIPAPELPTGTAGSIVTYDENGDIGGELEPGWVAFNGDPETSVPGLVATGGGGGFTSSQFGILNQIMAAGGLSTNVTIEQYQSRGSGAADDGTNMDNFVPTVRAVAIGLSKKQAKKTCAGWMDGTTTPDATHTDANCVLWNLPD